MTNYSGNGLIRATNLPDLIFNLLASAPIFFSFSYVNKRKILILSLVVLALVYSFYFGIGFVLQDPHTKEVGEYLKTKTSEGDILVAPKSVAYYANRRVYSNENNLPKLDVSLTEYFERSFRDREMTSSFFWPSGFFDSVSDSKPLLSEKEKISYIVLYHALPNKFPDKVIGDFYVYRITDNYLNGQT